MSDPKFSEIVGTIETQDGRKREFRIVANDGEVMWFQGGADKETLGGTVELVEALRDAAIPFAYNPDTECERSGEHQPGADHRWQECPVYDGEGDDE